MSKREVPQTRQKRTKRVNVGTPRGSSLRAANVRRKLDASERLAAPAELLIENVRCFAGRHEIPIRPLTVLVGENSSGKSTLLAALSVMCNRGFPLYPEFNEPPYSLGNFQTIATHEGKKKAGAPTFSLGFKDLRDAIPRSVAATYVLQRQRTALLELRIERAEGTAALTLDRNAEEFVIKVSPSPTSDWLAQSFRVPQRPPGPSREGDFLELYLPHFERPDVPASGLKTVIRAFSNRNLTSAVSIAPIRTKPERRYDEDTEGFSPEGRHIPFVLARVLGGSANPKSKANLLKGLKSFGEESGLFKDIDIRNLGDQPGALFQVMITVGRRPFSLLDVGYGVSQALPLVVQSILGADEDLLLLQQPEVHLHPKAQAALGSFFVDLLAQTGKSFVVETHSDYIVDRIRMDIADGKLPSEAFLILYLERKGTETTVYPITVDSLGNLLGVPPTYRAFFLREEMNLLTRGG
jgi:energy-coupling factor transporter ATP-binding protein EcfA2